MIELEEVTSTIKHYIPRKYTLEEIWLTSTPVSSVKSRQNVDISTKIGPQKLSIPIISAPMKDVASCHSISEIILNGGIGLIHRFNTIDEQVEEFTKVNNRVLTHIMSGNFNYTLADNIGCAIGIDKNSCCRLSKLYRAGCRLFCIDVANGANTEVGRFITDVVNKYNDVKLIVGNVGSAEGYLYLAGFPNVIGIRCGIAGGNCCTTKNATGILSPMASLLLEIRDSIRFSSKPMPAIIADGGIGNATNFVKAIALGADCCMLGSALAATAESPAEICDIDGKKYKLCHGSASFQIQQLYKDKPQFIEGARRFVEYNGDTIGDLFKHFEQGLRSSMSYYNATDIPTFQDNVDYYTNG